MTNLTRSTPVNNLIKAWEPLNPWANDLWGGPGWDPFAITPFEPWHTLKPWMIYPLDEVFREDNLEIDLYEEEDKLVVKATLVGVRPEDIEVTEERGLLTIRVKNEAQMEQSENGWSWRGYHFAGWQRTVPLPAQVDIQKAKAVLENGILTVSLPKLQPHKKLVHRIQINLPKIKVPGLNKKQGKVRIKHVK
jgi:HSP20 family protein